MNLSSEQIEAFRKLWFIYGNHGKKCTSLNHKLIQGFFEYQEDRRKDYRQAEINIIERFGKNNPRLKDLVTEECFRACDLVLNGKIDEAIKLAKT